MKSGPSAHPLIEYALSACVFIILALYSYALVFEIPMVGFEFDPGDGRVMGIFGGELAGQGLQIGDRILQAGPVSFEEYLEDKRQPLLEDVRPGEVIRLRIERDGRSTTVNWEIPLPKASEILDRIGTLWLPYLFWAAGTATLFLVRPKDLRWRLLVVFYYFTALWLMMGLVSPGAIWHSAVLLRMFIWLSVPVYLQLHWVFPRPLGSLPRGLVWVFYLGAFALAGLEWFQALPSPAYFAGFILAIGGSLILLIAHALRQPEQRRDLRVLGGAFLIIILSTLVIGTLAAELLDVPLWYGWGALFGLPALPGAYFYVIYRRQLGGLELRANRIITLYILLILLFSFAALISIFLINQIPDRDLLVPIGAGISLLVGLAIAATYQDFQRFIERRFLGMPLAPTYLYESCAARITTSLDIAGLVHLLRDEILPSLLIRQSALLRCGEEVSPATLYAVGVQEEGLADKTNQAFLINLVQSRGGSGGVLSPIAPGDGSNPLPWIRVVLPLKVGGELIGLWLLGSRDPDDSYAQSEISVLTAIANQTAVALTNITHAERLHAFYQADIERQEQERARLARGLHDEVLNELASMAMRAGDLQVTPDVIESYQLLTTYLRSVINDLRPAMLAYGLGPALNELIDQLSDRVVEEIVFQIDLPGNDVRYAPQVEQHVFRIVEQACENALRHAQAKIIRIDGDLEADRIRLVVKDDGRGSSILEKIDLNVLLIAGHYGLVGMFERAAIIGAELRFKSDPEIGTLVEITWGNEPEQIL